MKSNRQVWKHPLIADNSETLSQSRTRALSFISDVYLARKSCVSCGIDLTLSVIAINPNLVSVLALNRKSVGYPARMRTGFDL
jgi:hypothetical protein